MDKREKFIDDLTYFINFKKYLKTMDDLVDYIVLESFNYEYNTYYHCDKLEKLSLKKIEAIEKYKTIKNFLKSLSDEEKLIISDYYTIKSLKNENKLTVKKIADKHNIALRNMFRKIAKIINKYDEYINSADMVK